MQLALQLTYTRLYVIALLQKQNFSFHSESPSKHNLISVDLGFIVLVTLQRPDSLKVDAQDVTGARFEVNLTGLAARVFQHEYDHLQVHFLTADERKPNNSIV